MDRDDVSERSFEGPGSDWYYELQKQREEGNWRSWKNGRREDVNENCRVTRKRRFAPHTHPLLRPRRKAR